jgi:tetratricopeptide (TPR) repeat protein
MKITVKNIFFNESDIAILHGVSEQRTTSLFAKNIFKGVKISKLASVLKTDEVKGEKIIDLIDSKYLEYQNIADRIVEDPSIKEDLKNGIPLYPLLRVDLLDETGSPIKCIVDDDNNLLNSENIKKMTEQAKEEIESKENNRCYQELYEYFYKRQEELIDSFRYQEAKGVLEEALEYFPDKQGFKINLGFCQSALGEHDNAMETLNNILRSDKECYLAYINRAILFRELKKYSKSITDLETAIDVDEEDMQAYRELSITYCEMGKPKQALEYAKILIEEEPEEEETYLTLGFIYNIMGKNKRALSALNHVLNEINPFDHWALLNRGKILFEEFNETGKALNDLKLAHDLGNPHAKDLIDDINNDLDNIQFI